MAKPIPAVLPLTKASLSFRPRSIASSLSNQKARALLPHRLGHRLLLSRQEAASLSLPPSAPKACAPLASNSTTDLWPAHRSACRGKRRVSMQEFDFDTHHVVVVLAALIRTIVPAWAPQELPLGRAISDAQRRTACPDCLGLGHDHEDRAPDVGCLPDRSVRADTE